MEKWINSDSDRYSKMTLKKNGTREAEICWVACAVETGMNRNLKFSKAMRKQICPEMSCVLLACFL